MYKLKKGVELPKEFKIKVNADESKALQEYCVSIGIKSLDISHIISYLDYPYVYLRSKNTYLTGDDEMPRCKEKFEKDPLPQIHFKDYFYLDFPEKFCIEVTEDNYKELDVWMHRNWKNYKGYSDRWKVVNNIFVNLYFYSESIEIPNVHKHTHSYGLIGKNYTLITTDQFRGKFGNLKVHDVEIISNYVKGMAKDFDNSIVQKMSETKAHGTEPGEKELIGEGRIEFNGWYSNDFVKGLINNCDYVFSDGSKMKLSELIKINDYYQDRSNYYKEKSDRLRKEKFEMSKDDFISSWIEQAKTYEGKYKALLEEKKDLINNHYKTVDSLREEIRQLKTTIAQKDVIIEKVRKENDQLTHEVLSKEKIAIERTNDINQLSMDSISNFTRLTKKYVKSLKKIKKLKNKVKWLSLR